MGGQRAGRAGPRARVVGAGVTGLTTALALARDGWSVEVITAEPPSATTSAVAAAVWFPYLVGPAAAVATWGRASAEVFTELAADPAAPVTARTVRERFRTADVDPDWRVPVGDAVREQVAPPFLDGWRWTSWVADMPGYLAWLLDHLAAHEVTVVRRRVATLRDAFGPGTGGGARDVHLVVDCVGVEARDLVPDPAVTSVAGQVVLVRAPSVTDVWLDADGDEGVTYVIPRREVVVVGGTAVVGLDDRTPDPQVAAAVLARAAALVPAVADAPVVGHAVGRRPARPDVRLEVEDTEAGPVLHHYGHGGAGVTMSWGAAAAATALAAAVRG